MSQLRLMKTDIAAALSQFKPFSQLPRQELDRLAHYCSTRRITSGGLIYSEDEWVDCLWALTEGLVRLTIMPSFGGQSTVNIFRQGDLVGCLNGVCRHKHPTEGLALTGCAVVVIPKRRYLDLLEHKDFSLGIIHILGERLWDAQMMRAAAAQSSEKRLAWTLLWLHSRLGRRIPMTRRLIAEAAGVARETSIRILSPMEKQGWLKTRRGLLEIVRPDKLRETLESR